MQVLKFGGSSVASADAMLQVIQIVRKALETDRTIVVSSAISGCTDELIAIGRLAGVRAQTVASPSPKDLLLQNYLREALVFPLFPIEYLKKK